MIVERPVYAHRATILICETPYEIEIEFKTICGWLLKIEI